MIGAFRSSYCSIVPASSCSLSGPLLYRSPVVVFLDRGYPYFRNFNSTIPVDVVGVKSFVNSFLDPTCVPVRISINKLDLIPDRIVAGLVGVFRSGGGLGTGESYIPVVFFDQYLAYDSHHPRSVKRGIVQCLYDRAKRLVTKPSVIADIPPLLYRRSQRHEQPQEESLSPNLNPPPFYLMSKEFRSLSAAA